MKNKMEKTFDNRFNQYCKDMQQKRYPHSDAELDREIRRTVWGAGNEESSMKDEASTKGPSRAYFFALRSPFPWLAAACLAAVLLPLGLRAHAHEGLQRVDIGGEHPYFVCNRGCSAESTIDNLNTLIGQ